MPRQCPWIPLLGCMLLMFAGCTSGMQASRAGCGDSTVRTLYVDDGAPAGGDGSSMAAAFRSITEAASAASSGDRICISDGTYEEGKPIVLDKDLLIQGAGSEPPVISGGDAHTVITVAPGVQVTLEKLTVSNGLGPSGGGIYSEGSLRLADSVVTDSRAFYGGGIFVAAGSLVLGSGTVISDNDALGQDAGWGGGVYIEFGSLTMKGGVSVQDNFAMKSGGGVYVDRDGAATIESGARIEENNAAVNGGGLFNFGSAQIESQSSVARNAAGQWGGGIWQGGSLKLASDAVVAGNLATWGGGIYLDSGATIDGPQDGVADNLPDNVFAEP